MAIQRVDPAKKRPPRQSAISLEDEARIHALGKDFVSRFAMLFKTVRIHSVHNSALQYSVKIFVEAGNALHKHLGDYTLRGDVDSVFINDIRIRPEAILWDNIVHLLEELADRGIGGIRFTGILLPVGVRKLLQLLLDNPNLDLDTGARQLTEKMRGQGVNVVEFLPRMSLITDAQPILEEEVAKALQAIRTYTELLVTWKAYLAIEDPAVPDIIRGRLLTAVQASVDMLHEDPDWFLSATAYRAAEMYQTVHAVNSALLAMALGHRIELSRKALMNLGMAALYATSGLRGFGVDQQMRTQENTAADFMGLEAYPLKSVKEILQTPALTRAQRDRILVAYEHRIGSDGSGFPPAIKGKPKHLFSSIVSLASRYDQLTSSYGVREALSCSQALEVMTEEVELYDPRLLAVLAHLLGPFPLGTAVELSTGEIAIVFRLNPDVRFRARPLVKIVLDSKGRAVPPALFDLTSADDGGTFLASIRRAVPPKVLDGISVAQVLFAQTSEGADADSARPRWDG